MLRFHRRAVWTIVVASLLDVLLGLAFSVTQHVEVGRSLYWAVVTATSVGYGDVTPKDGVGEIIAVLVMLTVLPLFAATFSLVTAAITTERVATYSKRQHGELHARLDRMFRHLEIPEEKSLG